MQLAIASLLGHEVDCKNKRVDISHPFGVRSIELCTFLPIQFVCVTPKGWDFVSIRKCPAIYM